ncbi:MAG: hypothetical protein IJ523_00255 [Succinivibrionaceae bacterium]|nr:hypothetical protein [Succinivibrionaceae bacterium]
MKHSMNALAAALALFASLCLAQDVGEGETIFSCRSQGEFADAVADVLRRLDPSDRPAFHQAALEVNIHLNNQASSISYLNSTPRDEEMKKLLEREINGRTPGQIVAFAAELLSSRMARNEVRKKELAALAGRIDPGLDLVKVQREYGDCDGAVFLVSNNVADSAVSTIRMVAGVYRNPGDPSTRFQEWGMDCTPLGASPEYGGSERFRCHYPMELAAKCRQEEGVKNIVGYRETFFDANYQLKEYAKGFISYTNLNSSLEQIDRDNELIRQRLSALKSGGLGAEANAAADANETTNKE